MKRVLLGLLFTFVFLPLAWAQDGSISGEVKESATGEPVVGAIVQALSGGQTKAQAVTSMDGYYILKGLVPGKYDVVITSLGLKKVTITGLEVNNSRTTRVKEVKMVEDAVETGPVTIIAEKPLIDKDKPSFGATYNAEQIANMPTRSVNDIINTMPGVYSADQGSGLSIRGNRDGDNAIFVDGVRVRSGVLPPPEVLQELDVSLGGVSASVGDVIGGVISATTKSAAREFYGSAVVESSRPFDQYGYDLLGFNLSGPLLKEGKRLTDTAGAAQGPAGADNRRTILGFVTNIQYQGNRDADPSAYGIWKLKDSELDALMANPVTLQAAGTTRYISRATFFDRDRFENIAYRPNAQRHSFNGTLKFDYQPAKNILITLGGFSRYDRQNAGGYLNLLNWEENPLSTTSEFQGFLRFRQSFPNIGGKEGLLKDVYYQVQVDYTRSFSRSESERHGENVFKYNYIGRFTERSFNDTIRSGVGPTGPIPVSRTYLNVDPNSGAVDTIVLTTAPNTIIREVGNRRGLVFQGSDINSRMSRYNTAIYNILGDNIFNGGAVSASSIADGSLSSVYGMGINGNGLPNVTYPFASRSAAGNVTFGLPGETINGSGNSLYLRSTSEQYRGSMQVGAQLGRHALRMGFEYEQRVIRSYNVRRNPWTVARGLLNRQLRSTNSGQIVDTVTTFDPNTNQRVINVTTRRLLNRDESGNILGQTDFDRNLRNKLGLAPNGADEINLDAVDVNLLSMNLFSGADIFNNGFQPLATWSGYDVYGNRVNGRVAFNDFFLDTINRPVDAFRPIYLGGYIEDKFEINDLIVRIGLRMDRFDVNNQVLRDPYSFTRLTAVSETDFSLFAGNFRKPSNIPDNAVVYVDRTSNGYDGTASSQGQFRVIGFRDGNRWYRADGQETANPRDLEVSGNIFPWYNPNRFDLSTQEGRIQDGLIRNRGISLDAFEDFKPRWNFMPRISFSFPISEDALFYAYYDILTQRPLTFQNGSNFGSPAGYYAASQPSSYVTSGNLGAYISNPNLLPQRKIDYSIGFQQRLTDRSALKFNVSYQEIKDLIQAIRLTGAYPVTYTTDGNQDFSVTKSGTLEYELRFNDYFRMDASYTLQFAETSSSNFATTLLANTANPNLRNTVFANTDSRHAFKHNLTFGTGDKSPVLFGVKPFTGIEITMTNILFTGTPYTRYQYNFTGDVVQGSINGSRLPANFRTNIRIEKAFTFQKEGQKRPKILNVYVYVNNLFDIRNVVGVYERTGSATDDGYLNSDQGNQDRANAVASGLSASVFNNYYNFVLQNPNFVTLPRWVRLGASFTF